MQRAPVQDGAATQIYPDGPRGIFFGTIRISIFDISTGGRKAGPCHRFSISSISLPGRLTDADCFALWHEMHQSEIAALEYSSSDIAPFHARVDVTLLARSSFGRTSGTLRGVHRTKANIAADGVGGHSLFVNTGNAMIGGEHLGKTFALDPGAAVMISNADPVRLVGGPQNEWLCVVVPEGALQEAFGSPDDRLAEPVPSGDEALMYLGRYCGFLDDDRPGSPPLTQTLLAHASDTVLDLVGLATGLKQRRGQGSELSGLRQVRLMAIEQAIALQFCEPTFSVAMIGRELRLSSRYIYELLQESGASFSERVMERRLEKTRLMLSDRRNDHLLISEIAFRCGFNDISYFNRSFRRRFGCSPGAAR